MIIQRAIIPVAGVGTRFLPLSRVFPKEFLPLGDKALLHYIVEEIKNSGIGHCVFVVRPGQNYIAEYFNCPTDLEKLLRTKKRDHLISELRKIQELRQGLSFSFVPQKTPSGDAYAVLLAMRESDEKEPCAVLFPDDIVLSQVPCIAQLISVFRTAQKPIIALKRVARERISHYGSVEVERIANRFYKVKRIVEKPSVDEAPSDLAIVGRYLLTPEVFEYIHAFAAKKAKAGREKFQPGEEFLLADILNAMVADGKIVYGYEIEGEWLECGTKETWIKANISYLLRHSPWQKELRQHFKNIKNS